MKYLVYIIDDDSTTGAEYLKALGGSEVFDAKYFPTMEEADAAAKECPPHILLADIRLDKVEEDQTKDATKYLEKIRAGRTNFDRRISVVLFTGAFPMLGVETFKRAVAQNANALFVKNEDIKPETAAEVLKQVLDEDEARKRALAETHANAEIIRALKIIKARSPASTLIVVPVGGVEEKKLTIDEIIRHMELNDEFAQNFRVGLNAVVVALLEGTERTEQ